MSQFVVGKVGVVGLGNMGLGMALTLKGKGFDVRGYDVGVAARDKARDQDLPLAESVAELAAHVDLLILSLPSSEVVEAVVLGVAGVRESARPGLVVLDTTTASPASTRKVAAALSEQGVALLDGPVSGGPKGAASGSMTMVLGGEPSVIERCKPVIEALSAKYVHVGPVGAGHVTKLLNNLLCGAQLALAGEAERIARGAGLDPQKVFEGINAGSGRSAATQVNYPTWVFNQTFNSGFTMKLMRKDMRLAMELLGQSEACAALSSAAGRLWAESAQSLADEEDFNQIVNYPGAA
jgi:3-hydroxyisobutyrate dehydrogenase